MGIDPASKKTVEWLASDKKFMNSMFNRVFHPYEKDGVDFWWLDWQQWPEDKAVAGLKTIRGGSTIASSPTWNAIQRNVRCSITDGADSATIVIR